MEPTTSGPTPTPNNPEEQPNTPQNTDGFQPAAAPAPVVISPTTAPASPYEAPSNAAAPASSAATPEPAAPTAVASPYDPTTPSTPLPPTPGQPMINGSFGAAPSGFTPGQPSQGKPKWFLPAIIAAGLVVVLGGGYVFGYYMPNQPATIYNKSLTNTGKAVDVLINYAETQQKTSAKGTTFNGSVNIKNPTVSADISVSGAFDKDSNGKATISTDIAGEKIDANFLTIHAANSTNPDIYAQVSGFKPLLDAVGESSFDSLDGQWISIDHTLLDSLQSQVAQSGSNTAYPSAAQVEDAVSKVQTVNKQYIFTGDKSKAVLVNQKFIGKETMDGRSVDHFQTGYDKANLKAYVGAVKTALDSSKLNDWSKKANDGKSISETMNISSINSSIDSAKPYVFDLYADTSTKLVHALTFHDTSDTKISFTISQNYTGGDSYPFAFKVANSSASDGGSFTLGTTLNTKSNSADITMKGSFKDDSGTTTIDGKFTIAPSDSAVSVTAPAKSKSITDVLNQFGLGGLSSSSLDSSLGADNSSLNSDLFTLNQ